MAVPASRRTSWFITLPIAALAIGYLTLVFFPTARTIKEIRDEIRLKQNFIAQTETLHSATASLERELSEVEQYNRKWHRQTPRPEQLAVLFGKIDEKARQAGATMTKFDPQPVVVLDVLHRVPLQMELTGKYSEVCS